MRWRPVLLKRLPQRARSDPRISVHQHLPTLRSASVGNTSCRHRPRRVCRSWCSTPFTSITIRTPRMINATRDHQPRRLRAAALRIAACPVGLAGSINGSRSSGCRTSVRSPSTSTARRLVTQWLWLQFTLTSVARPASRYRSYAPRRCSGVRVAGNGGKSTCPPKLKQPPTKQVIPTNPNPKRMHRSYQGRARPSGRICGAWRFNAVRDKSGLARLARSCARSSGTRPRR